MGGEIYTYLYVGPNEEKNLIEWSYVFNLIDIEKILSDIKNSKKYKEFNDDTSENQGETEEEQIEEDKVLLSDWIDPYLYEFYEKLEIKLRELDLVMVFTSNMSSETFKIGREIDNIRQNIENDVNLWKNYGLDVDVDIYAGFEGGSFQLECDFPEYIYEEYIRQKKEVLGLVKE